MSLPGLQCSCSSVPAPEPAPAPSLLTGKPAPPFRQSYVEVLQGGPLRGTAHNLTQDCLHSLDSMPPSSKSGI